jgi:hypothetical protein
MSSCKHLDTVQVNVRRQLVEARLLVNVRSHMLHKYLTTYMRLDDIKHPTNLDVGINLERCLLGKSVEQRCYTSE